MDAQQDSFQIIGQEDEMATDDATAVDLADGADDTMGDAGFEVPMEEQQASPAQAVDMGGSNNMYASISSMDSEPAAITEWREKRAAMLAAKDVEEQAAIAAIAQKGAQETKDFYAKDTTARMERKESNETQEAAFVSQRDGTKPGSEWEKVGWLCDFNVIRTPGNRDITRMKSVLIQLKSNGLVR